MERKITKAQDETIKISEWFRRKDGKVEHNIRIDSGPRNIAKQVFIREDNGFLPLLVSTSRRDVILRFVDDLFKDSLLNLEREDE